MTKVSAEPLLIRGNVVHPDGEAHDRYLLVRDGHVQSVSRARPPLSAHVKYVETDRQDWIFPGLLDLHTHSTYNLLPLWESINAPYDNRFEWRSDPLYKQGVRLPSKKLSAPEHSELLAVFSELQAVAGGTAVLQESTDLEKDVRRQRRTLICRDTASTADLLLNPTQRILSVVDFFRPDRDTGQPSPVNWSLDAYTKGRKTGKLVATLAHVAEGRSGVGSDRGADAYSRAEFEAFMRHAAFKDSAAVRSTPLTIIHGSGIDSSNPKHIDFLRDRNISVVWSPVSNFLLYGDTLDVESLITGGINVALGSDWSPSGSKHVWDEAKFAKRYLEAIGSSISQEQVFQMVTTKAALCLGLNDMGRIGPGSVADFFILRSPLESGNPMEVFFGTDDRHVRCVVIGGQPVYGDWAFLKTFGLKPQRLPRQEGSAVKNKGVYLPKGIKVDVQRDISRIETELKSLDPPVKRSNLLASADKPYQRRIQLLKSSVARFGWSARQWRKHGPSKTPRQVPVSPDSVRVWRGYRQSGWTPEAFCEKLGMVFIPSAVQTQVPLGMTAYLPTVLPIDKPETVPDEIALVFYESKEIYGKTFQSTTGRAYGLLHSTIFAPTRGRNVELKSASGWPSLLEEDAVRDQAYHLLSNDVDWQHGAVHVYVGARKEQTSNEDFADHFFNACRLVQDSTPRGLDAAIVVFSAHYVALWEHWSSSKTKRHAGRKAFQRLADSVLDQDAVPLKVVADGFATYPGIDIQGGECLNVQFTRRREFRW